MRGREKNKIDREKKKEKRKRMRETVRKKRMRQAETKRNWIKDHVRLQKARRKEKEKMGTMLFGKKFDEESKKR